MKGTEANAICMPGASIVGSSVYQPNMVSMAPLPRNMTTGIHAMFRRLWPVGSEAPSMAESHTAGKARVNPSHCPNPSSDKPSCTANTNTGMAMDNLVDTVATETPSS